MMEDDNGAPSPHRSGGAASRLHGGTSTSLGIPWLSSPPSLYPGDPRRALTHFSQANVSHYDIFLLREDEEELYVGARDRLLALAVGTPGTIRAQASVSSGAAAMPSAPASVSPLISHPSHRSRGAPRPTKPPSALSRRRAKRWDRTTGLGGGPIGVMGMLSPPPLLLVPPHCRPSASTSSGCWYP